MKDLEEKCVLHGIKVLVCDTIPKGYIYFLPTGFTFDEPKNDWGKRGVRMKETEVSTLVEGAEWHVWKEDSNETL